MIGLPELAVIIGVTLLVIVMISGIGDRPRGGGKKRG